MDVPHTRVIEIPLEGSENVLEIDCSQLPESSFDICEVLEQEKSHIKFYLIFALEYYRQDKLDEAIFLLKRGLSRDTLSDVLIKLPLINCLANIYIHKGKSLFIQDSNKNISFEDPFDFAKRYDSFNTIQNDIKNGKDAFFQLASTLFKEADRISPDDPSTMLGRAILHLANNQLDSSLSLFNSILNKDPKNIGALQGKARVQLSKGLYSSSLSSFQSILSLYPFSKPDPRIGIAICFSNLGKIQESKLSLERDPKNIAAKVMLSTTLFNEAKELMSNSLISDEDHSVVLSASKDIVNIAMSTLRDAYQMNPNNPSVLLLLSGRFYLQNKLNLSEDFAKKAFILSDSPTIQSDAQFHLARVYHSLANYPKAHEHYQKSLSLNQSNYLSRFGLGKIQIYNSKMAAAVSTFQNLLSVFPQCIEIIDSLAYLHSKLSNQKLQAVEYYELEIKTIISCQKSDYNGDWSNELHLFSDPFIFLQCASLLESISVSKSKSYYLAAKSIYTGAHLKESDKKYLCNSYSLPQIMNNIGALYLLSNENDLGVKELNNALQSLINLNDTPDQAIPDSFIDDPSYKKSSTNGIQNPPLSESTIKYNLARAHEVIGNFDIARRLHSEILEKYPLYVDSMLRLSVISYRILGDHDLSQSYIAKALRINPSNISSLLIKAEFQLCQGDLQSGRRTLEFILKNVDRHDLYTLCSLGNYYLKAVRSESLALNLIIQSLNPATVSGLQKSDCHNILQAEKFLNEPTRSEYKKRMSSLTTNYKRAHEFFKKCLTLSPRCLAAVSGFGAVMAERGFFKEARDILLEVHDAQTSYTIDASLVSSSTTTSSAQNSVSSSKSLIPSSNNGNAKKGTNPIVAPNFVDSFSSSNLGYELPLVLGGGPSEDIQLSVTANLAHIYSELGQHRASTNLYEGCIKRAQLLTSNVKSYASNFSETSISRSLQLCYAKTLYTQARIKKSIPTMQQAISILSNLCSESERLEKLASKQSDFLSQSLLDKSKHNNTDEALNDMRNSSELLPSVNSDSFPESNNKNLEDESSKSSNMDLNDGTPATLPEKQIPVLSISKNDNTTVLVDECDPILLYDLALAKQYLAQMVSDLTIEQCSLEELESVTAGLDESNLVFLKISSAKEPLSELTKKLKSNNKLNDSNQPSSEKSMEKRKVSLAEKNLNSIKFGVDPKMALQRASFGKYLYTSLQNKIVNYVELEEKKKLQAAASRKRRLEHKKLVEEQNLAKLEEQRIKDEEMLIQTKLKNERLRAEMTITDSYDAGNTYNEGQSNSDSGYKNNGAADYGAEIGVKSEKGSKRVNRKNPRGTQGSTTKVKRRVSSKNKPGLYEQETSHRGSDLVNSNSEVERSYYSSDNLPDKKPVLSPRSSSFKKRRRDIIESRSSVGDKNRSQSKRNKPVKSRHVSDISDEDSRYGISKSRRNGSRSPSHNRRFEKKKQRIDSESSDISSSNDTPRFNSDKEKFTKNQLPEDSDSSDVISFKKSTRIEGREKSYKRERDYADYSKNPKKVKNEDYQESKDGQNRSHASTDDKFVSSPHNEVETETRNQVSEPEIAAHYSENELFGIDSDLSSDIISGIDSDLSD
ncbi:RNA polymerase-associated protein CTR9-like protein [Smittium mucronatum]|uniref:RNA polymerase-associated protein CTR9-like protein n=1 Tax=Smittium mucronatum TaxID=133383 RepID=A0A1R0H6S0_9FUNG|nr:RNA polymerase-associated protein CTR9-like protein [Smittium mucronatum]